MQDSITCLLGFASAHKATQNYLKMPKVCDGFCNLIGDVLLWMSNCRRTKGSWACRTVHIYYISGQ